MKIRNLVLITILAFTSSITLAQKKTIKTSDSKIEWIGKKVTGSHQGTLNFKDGFLTFDNGRIAAGEFTVDMNSLAVTDLEGKGKANLEGHLKSDDFFGVANHATAKLVIKSTNKFDNKYSVKADLTIKGQTHPVAFDFIIDGNKATTTVKVDRTKYGIRYGSGSFFDNLGDKAIDNEFELKVNIIF